MDSYDSGFGVVTVCCEQRNDPLNSTQSQESDNQPRFSELLKRIVFNVLSWLLLLGR